MEKIIFADKHGQQIYNIHATLKVTFDVDAVVAQLLEDNRGVLPGDIELSIDDIVESVRDTIESMAYLAEHMTVTERIADNNGKVY
jgi:hypothetical protein